MRKPSIYAIYKGDYFIDVGTAEELAERLNVKVDTIMYYATPTYKKRNKGGQLETVRIEEEAE